MGLFGHCKLCQEKNARIADLKAQVARLERLVFPPVAHASAVLPALDAPEDAQGETVTLTVPSWEAVNFEANKILTGTY